MNVEEKEEKIIALSVERFKILQILKTKKNKNPQNYILRLQAINKEIEELIQLNDLKKYKNKYDMELRYEPRK